MHAAFLAVAAFVKLKDYRFNGLRYRTLTALTITRDLVRALRNNILEPILACATVRSFGALYVAELEGFSEAMDGLSCCCGHNYRAPFRSEQVLFASVVLIANCS